MKRCWLAVMLAIAPALRAPAAVVDIQPVGEGRFELRRDGAAYFIRGAGGVSHLDRLAACGANSVRTWGSEQTAVVIDEAGRLGLTVCAGLWIDQERQGFNYDDAAAVRAQVERHCRAVDRFKNHPALLLWAVGNEVESRSTNPKVWDAIEAVAAYIKRVDPHHPVMTVTAHVSAAAVAEIRRRCPSIDLLGCNCYAGIAVIARDIRATGWTKPYLVTEWGSDGNWEVAKTPWGAEVEPTSSGKAAQRAERYRFILGDPGRCLGSYAFYWGQKQETTPTWFNLFTEDGSETESIEVLAQLWTGRVTGDRAPQVSSLRLNGAPAAAGVHVRAGAPIAAVAALQRADARSLRARWELLPESRHKGFGGDTELRPERLPPADARETLSPAEARLMARAPREPGAYRLFLYVYGPGRTVATANFPFQVDADE